MTQSISIRSSDPAREGAFIITQDDEEDGEEDDEEDGEAPRKVANQSSINQKCPVSIY